MIFDHNRPKKAKGKFLILTCQFRQCSLSHLVTFVILHFGETLQTAVYINLIYTHQRIAKSSNHLADENINTNGELSPERL